MNNRIRSAASALLGLVLSGWQLQAQGADTLAQFKPLPQEVALEVVALYNAASVVKSTSKVSIPAGRTITGDVNVLNGPLTIGGRVIGRVLAINADVILEAGARIDGDLLVVGGEVEGLEHAQVGGETRVYHPALRYTMSGDVLVAETQGAPTEQWWRRWERRGQRSSNRLDIASAGVYSRVEGLPVRIGPVLYRDQGWGHLRFEAAAILRTASSFSSSKADVGHDVQGEMRIGREHGATFAARLFDVVDAVENWQLSDVEASLESFIVHRDYRDYFERHGGRVSVALRASENADLTLGYSDERWSSRDARDPFSLFRDGELWRTNPHVDDGRFHLANLTLHVDTRNDDFNPLAGWYVLADYERGAGQVDQAGPTSGGLTASTLEATRYQRGFLDVRRYNRLGPSSALNLRVVLGGWLSGDPLPLERRLSLDGPGTVPGFPFRVTGGNDVGTCGLGAPLPGRPAQCERLSLAQLEYRSDIRISRTVGDAADRRIRFHAEGAWVFFTDAGRGWMVNAPKSPLNYARTELPPLSTYRTDIGTGLDFDVFGIYVAKALSDPDEPLSFFLRVRHRF